MIYIKPIIMVALGGGEQEWEVAKGQEITTLGRRSDLIESPMMIMVWTEKYMNATFCIGAPFFPLKNNKSQGQGKADYVKTRFGMARETWVSASFLTFRNRYLVLEWRHFHVNISYT